MVYLRRLGLSFAWVILLVSGGHLSTSAQSVLYLPPLTKVALNEVQFRSPEELKYISKVFVTYQLQDIGQEVSIDRHTILGTGVDMNATRLGKDLLPSWMESEMWYSSKRSMDRMFSTNPKALDVPAVERNFEMHLDAEELYRSQNDW